MSKALRLCIGLSMFLLASVPARAFAQYPPIDIDIENANSNVNESVNENINNNVNAVPVAFDPFFYGGVRHADQRSLPKTGSDDVVLALYALTLFSVGMVLLRHADKRRFRLALADQRSAAAPAAAPVADQPRIDRGHGLVEGDLLLPPPDDDDR
jgi:hypothetical protein